MDCTIAEAIARLAQSGQLPWLSDVSTAGIYVNSIYKVKSCVGCIRNCSIARHIVNNWRSLYLFIGLT